MSSVLRLPICFLLLISTCSYAQRENIQSAHAQHALGKVDFRISCSAVTQPVFDAALALLHHMTYPQARADFERITSIDPHCAMGYWGIAMTLFQPLWPTRPGPEALMRGWEATQRAKSLQPPTERERLFIAAAESFFSDPKSTDYWARIRRWTIAQQQAYEALPNDDEAAAFYALARLASAPTTSSGHEEADRTAEILMRVYRHNPEHPGAMHYLVHANDVPGREHELLFITRKYEALAPDNPHALHMPTHIYTRLGEWDAVIRGNLRAADAALKYPAGEHGEFVWDEFPHAIEYLVYAYLQQGDDAKAAQQIRRLQSTARLEPTFKTAFHWSSTQARYALERHDWSAAFSIAPRTPSTIEWDRFPWAEAIAQFAHGLGAVHLGKADDARAAVERLQALEARSDATGEDLFARNIRLLRLELSAWLAHTQKDAASSLELLQAAVELERATPKPPVTPAPTLPASELLGDLFSENARPAQALAAYQAALTQYPNRFNSLAGAAREAQAVGNSAAAKGYRSALLRLAARDSRRDELKAAQAR